MSMDLNKASAAGSRQMLQYVNLKLGFLGCPTVGTAGDPQFNEMLSALLVRQQETDRLLADYLCPADARIQEFLQRTLQGFECPKLPSRTFVLDQAQLARTLSLPPDRDEFVSNIVSSYRVRQGVLHNPASEKRTTHGIFHIVEGGLPIADDKKGVPKAAYANLLKLALHPPRELLNLPFTSSQEAQAECWVSLLLRPLVCPAVSGFTSEKRTEIRFFVPGNLVSNLDFVETIFGNAGDPFLPANDAALDVEHWTGHTGCVILAPQLTGVLKKDIGLPHWDEATERQRRDGMCWKSADDKYNEGGAFKVACRDASGVMVTIITDNYFGYCKKEVKTQISFSANLSGHYEEEHAGGALVFPAYDLGEEFSGEAHAPLQEHNFADMLTEYGAVMQKQREGHALDAHFPDIVYVPENAHFDLPSQSVIWPHGDGESRIKLLPAKVYVRPSGYRVWMEKVPGGRGWRLVGTVAEGTLCHKPCTVSGGGKSEISKPITDAILQGPVYVADFQKDFDLVEQIINRDYSDRFSEQYREKLSINRDSRPILGSQRSLGSVIKLLIPASRDYNLEFNTWLKSIPQYIKELVFVVKRLYKPEWDGNWREHFSVDVINGTPGNELKCDNRKIISHYLRVGYEEDGSWRVFGLRQDFHPAAKLAVEDDISASIIVPSSVLENLNPNYSSPAVKFVQNCEFRLFQRPDDAIHRGYDKQCEADFAQPDNFFSNYEPLTTTQAREAIEDSIGFDEYTPPMQELIEDAATQPGADFFVSSAHPRLVDGKPSKNPRYLQKRPDLVRPRESYIADICARMRRRIPLDKPLYQPVNAVLPGRRNNPPDAAAGIRSLAVYNPIHYMELPELFMEFICSMTGKSPSTTGAGSEGAMTKGPFNALLPILDVNAALISYVLTGYDGFVTAAGYVGPKVRVDHDVSLLVPEVWCRMAVAERQPDFLIRNGYLEKCEDFEHDGQKVLTSRLGYRITRRFVRTYFGRVFNHPQVIFTEEMLRPEKQSVELVVDGMSNIVETQKRVAEGYFADGSIELACPPLRAILHIMRDGHFEGKELSDPDVRDLFSRESLLRSEWYQQRHSALCQSDARLWQRHVDYLEDFLARPNYAEEAARLGIAERLTTAKTRLAQLQS